MMNEVKDVVHKDTGHHQPVEEGMLVVEGEGEMHDEHWVLDDRMKRMIMDLQRHWLTDYQQSREKLLVEMTERVSLIALVHDVSISVLFRTCPFKLCGRC